jgi:hypothetical protein
MTFLHALLQTAREVRVSLVDLASSVKRVAVVLEALLEKLNTPLPSAGPTPEQLAALASSLASHDAPAAEALRIASDALAAMKPLTSTPGA